MYRAPIDAATPGARLGMVVFNDRCRPLVRAGVELSERLRTQIAARGYRRLVLLDSDEDADLEVLDPERRGLLLEALDPAVRFLIKGWQERRIFAYGDGAKLDTTLRRAVQDLIQDMDTDIPLVLPGHVRSGEQQALDDAVNAATVAIYLGRRFQLDNAQLARLAHGMLLRDVAMRVVPPDLVDHEGPLQEDAWEVVREHPLRAYEALSTLGWADEMSRLLILQHHERHDGSGYPHGLSGLHRVARSRTESLDHHLTLVVSDIAAVADVFNALTVDRPYRAPHPPHKVRAMLRQMAGSTLNAEIVEELLSNGRPPREQLAPTTAALSA